MATVKRIIINNEIYQLPRPLEVEEPINRGKVTKALINAWQEDYKKIKKENTE